MLAQDRRSVAVETALNLARLGYFVAPVTIRRGRDGKKRPTYHGQWGKISTTSAEQIAAWAAEYGPDLSFCVDAERSGIVGVDLDVKPEHGIDARITWAEEGLPIPPMVVHTPSGGMHHYWRMPAGETVTNRKPPWTGVDIRGVGGHLYAPGARVVGDPIGYEADQIVPVAELPELHPDILAKLPRDARSRSRASSPAHPLAYGSRHDRDWIVAQCVAQIDRVRTHTPTPESGFRHVLLGAAMMLGRAVAGGLRTREQAERMLGDAVHGVWGSVDVDDMAWIADGLDAGEADPWTVTETLEGSTIPKALTTDARPVVEVAATPNSPAPAAPSFTLSTPGGQRLDIGGGAGARPLPRSTPVQEVPVTVGDVAPEAEPWPGDAGYDAATAEEKAIAREVAAELRKRQVRRMADQAERPYRSPMREGLVDVTDLSSIAPPSMLVSGVIPDRAVGYLGGRSGSYKTFLAVAMACALARGRAPQGFAEWVPARRVNVLYIAAEGPSGVAARIRADQVVNGPLAPGAITVYPRPIDLTDDDAVVELGEIVVELEIGFVVVDTFGRSSGDAEDNSTTDTRRVFSALARLRDDHGVGGMFLDHTGHAGDRLRGASGKGDDADYVMISHYDGEDRGAHVQRTLRVRKLKDEASEAWWNIRLRQVEVAGVVDLHGNLKPVGVAEHGDVLGESSGPFGTVELQWWQDIDRELPDVVMGLSGPGARAAREAFRVLRYARTDMAFADIERAINGRPGSEPHSRTTLYAGMALLVDLVVERVGQRYSVMPEHLD